MEIFSPVCPRNCYSICSLKVSVENGKVVGIDPHPDNLATPDGSCIKGLAYIEMANKSITKITKLPEVQYIFTAHHGYTNDYKNAVKEWKE